MKRVWQVLLDANGTMQLPYGYMGISLVVFDKYEDALAVGEVTARKQFGVNYQAPSVYECSGYDGAIFSPKGEDDAGEDYVNIQVIPLKVEGGKDE